jgi:hypothetical protein
VVFVLWLHGCELAKICRLAMLVARTHLTADQIWGVIRNSPFRHRSTMTNQQRQYYLDVLKRERLDGGRIKDWAFTIKPLERRQR